MFGSASQPETITLGLGSSNVARQGRSVWPWVALAGGAVLLLLLGRCSVAMVKAEKMADGAVSEFHHKMNAEDYRSIYANSDRAFQQAGNEQQMTEFFRAMRRKLGSVQSARQVSIAVNASTNGSFLRLTYDTQFAFGNATEVFTWRMGLNGMKLVGYNIDSRELVTK